MLYLILFKRGFLRFNSITDYFQDLVNFVPYLLLFMRDLFHYPFCFATGRLCLLCLGAFHELFKTIYGFLFILDSQ